MSSRRSSAMAHVLLLLTVMVWGATFVVVKGALRDCTPLLFNQLRMLVAFGILAAVNAREWRRITFPAIRAGAVAGVFLATGYELQTVGLQTTTPAKSAFLTGLVVVLVPLLSVFPRLRLAGAKRPGVPTIAGAAVACAGIVLLTTPSGTTLATVTRTIDRGDVLSLLCAFAFALHLLALSKLARRIATAQLATLQIGFAALIMTVLTPVLEKPHLVWTGRLTFAIAVCAVFATALAFSVQSWAQRHLPATHTALLLALEPAFAWGISLAFFGERLSGRSAAGAALILGGLLVTEMLSGSHPVSENAEANQPMEAALPGAHTIDL